MKTILLLTLLSLVSGKPTGDEEISLIAEPVPDLTSGSAPAYWSAECGGRTYVGTYTLTMDWAQCKDYCSYFPHATMLGHTFSFADILNGDTMECLRYNMNSQYTPGNGYAGHYWAGGYLGGDGEFRWDSGAPFEFDDFVGNPGEDPYIHLTPGNNYQWDTKNDQNDRNNGCLCKSQEPASEVEVKDSVCPVGWYSVGEKCIRWTYENQLSWNAAWDYCNLHQADLVSWRSEAEFRQVKIFHQELMTTYGGFAVWTNANHPAWHPWNEFIWGRDTTDFVPMNYGWREGFPDRQAELGDAECCHLGHGANGLHDYVCHQEFSFMCEAI